MFGCLTTSVKPRFLSPSSETKRNTDLRSALCVTQLLSFTELAGTRLRNPLFAAYIPDDNLSLAGKIQVLEIEPSWTIFSPRTGLPEAQVWLIKHFSRYMLASG